MTPGTDPAGTVEATATVTPPPAAQPAPAAPSGALSAAEEMQLASLQARRLATAEGNDVVRLKVEPPHSAMTSGGFTIGTEFTSVPARFAAAIYEAAAAAGVTLTQEE